MTITYPLDYKRRVEEYNKYVEELEAQRKKFYEENPDFPFEYMDMNVIAPPQKAEIRFIAD